MREKSKLGFTLIEVCIASFLAVLVFIALLRLVGSIQAAIPNQATYQTVTLNQVYGTGGNSTLSVAPALIPMCLLNQIVTQVNADMTNMWACSVTNTGLSTTTLNTWTTSGWQLSTPLPPNVSSLIPGNTFNNDLNSTINALGGTLTSSTNTDQYVSLYTLSSPNTIFSMAQIEMTSGTGYYGYYIRYVNANGFALETRWAVNSNSALTNWNGAANWTVSNIQNRYYLNMSWPNPMAITNTGSVINVVTPFFKE